MEVADLVKNIIHAIYNILPHLLSKEITYDKVRQISIKGHKTPGLPIYSNLTEREVKVYKAKVQSQSQNPSPKQIVEKKATPKTSEKVVKNKKHW